MWISYDRLLGEISDVVKSFRMMSAVAKTYENLATVGEQQTRSLLGRYAFRNHIKILSEAGLYPLGGESIKVIRGWNGQQALGLLGSRLFSTRLVDDYPVGTSFLVSQIVYDSEGLLLNLDVLSGEEVIDIIGPFDTTQFIESFVFS